MTFKKIKTIKELEAVIQNSIKTFNYCKANLTIDGENVGIWSVPADQNSSDLVKDDSSHGAKVYLRLSNHPLWPGFFWGSLVVAKTNGDLCPIISEHQTDSAVLADQKQLKKLFEEEEINAEKKKVKKK